MTASEHDSMQDLAPAYALGALSADEAQRFEAILARSPDVQRVVAEYRDVAAMLALAGPEASPDSELRRRVVSRVSESSRRASGGPATPVIWGALAASLLLAAGLGAGLLMTRGESGRLRASLDSTSAGLAASAATLDAILRPGVQMFQLTASGDPDPGIQLFWDQARNQAILHGYRLRAVPDGQAYQLWFIQDGKPVPSVTFKPRAGAATVEGVAVPTGGEISAAAVTIEPESGSKEPTMPIVLVGPLKRS